MDQKVLGAINQRLESQHPIRWRVYLDKTKTPRVRIGKAIGMMGPLTPVSIFVLHIWRAAFIWNLGYASQMKQYEEYKKKLEIYLNPHCIVCQIPMSRHSFEMRRYYCSKICRKNRKQAKAMLEMLKSYEQSKSKISGVSK